MWVGDRGRDVYFPTPKASALNTANNNTDSLCILETRDIPTLLSPHHCFPKAKLWELGSETSSNLFQHPQHSSAELN